MITKKEFYFIRHGQTDHNLSPDKVDYSDISLNTYGRSQAEAIEPIISSLPIKTICFSPLKRAKETKDIISTRLSAKHREIAHLKECSTKEWLEMTSLGPQASFAVEKPVYNFIEQATNGINQALQEEGPVLIVAHGGIHWAICCLMGVDHEWTIDNCIPVHFSCVDDQWIAKKLI